MVGHKKEQSPDYKAISADIDAITLAPFLLSVKTSDIADLLLLKLVAKWKTQFVLPDSLNCLTSQFPTQAGVSGLWKSGCGLTASNWLH